MASAMSRRISPTASKFPGLDAVILATPTQMHAAQALQCLKAAKHVQIEIPLADNLKDAEAVVKAQKESGLVAMVGHTRRFNPSHQFVRQRILKDEFHIQQMDVQTFFFRRTNMNALGAPRSWTDHLLWHHAAHTVDLFAYQCRSPIVKANALQGPIHPTLGIAMDMSIQLKAENGAICTLSLSFNNEGPLGTFFRYIGDTATYIARYDDLFTGKDEKIDVSTCRCQHERHRIAGPRVLRRDPRGPRTQRQRRAGAAVLPGAGRPREADGVSFSRSALRLALQVRSEARQVYSGSASKRPAFIIFSASSRVKNPRYQLTRNSGSR